MKQLLLRTWAKDEVRKKIGHSESLKGEGVQGPSGFVFKGVRQQETMLLQHLCYRGIWCNYLFRSH